MAKGWPLGFMSHMEVLRVALRAKLDVCWGHGDLVVELQVLCRKRSRQEMGELNPEGSERIFLGGFWSETKAALVNHQFLDKECFSLVLLQTHAVILLEVNPSQFLLLLTPAQSCLPSIKGF